jgi:hypothetical protein
MVRAMATLLMNIITTATCSTSPYFRVIIYVPGLVNHRRSSDPPFKLRRRVHPARNCVTICMAILSLRRNPDFWISSEASDPKLKWPSVFIADFCQV